MYYILSGKKTQSVFLNILNFIKSPFIPSVCYVYWLFYRQHSIKDIIAYNCPAPDVPTITAASSKQSQSITVEFTQVSGASSYILRTETSKGAFVSETSVPGSPGTVSGLQPYTDYTLSVMSVNSGGSSQPSPSVQAKTGILPSLSTLQKTRKSPCRHKKQLIHAHTLSAIL